MVIEAWYVIGTERLEHAFPWTMWLFKPCWMIGDVCLPIKILLSVRMTFCWLWMELFVLNVTKENKKLLSEPLRCQNVGNPRICSFQAVICDLLPRNTPISLIHVLPRGNEVIRSYTYCLSFTKKSLKIPKG
jgi:hypothetical protein